MAPSTIDRSLVRREARIGDSLVRGLTRTRILACALAFAGCIQSSAVTCANGQICPEGTTCVALTDPVQQVCAQPDQLTACDGKSDYARCGTNRRCYSGACLATACGDGRVDRADPNMPGDVGEMCDDGNQTSGDGCSSDCSSDETCGNGVIDPIAGEVCDDGNLVSHDGCDSTCAIEHPRWTLLDSSWPVNRVSSMTYDAARERTVLFGGADASQNSFFDDTWEWDGLGWARLKPPQSPSARSSNALAYDATRRRVVLFGGANADGTLSDGRWDRTIDTPELLSAVGTFLAAGAAFASVGVIVLRHDPHLAWTWMIMVGWGLGVAMQIIAGAIARRRR